MATNTSAAFRCTVCREPMNTTLVNLGETTHPACVSELGYGPDHVTAYAAQVGL